MLHFIYPHNSKIVSSCQACQVKLNCIVYHRVNQKDGKTATCLQRATTVTHWSAHLINAELSKSRIFRLNINWKCKIVCSFINEFLERYQILSEYASWSSFPSNFYVVILIWDARSSIWHPRLRILVGAFSDSPFIRLRKICYNHFDISNR